MQLAMAALGWTGTAWHLTVRPFDRNRWGESDPPSLTSPFLQVVLARPPYRFPFLQGSSADVIQLPVMTAAAAVFFKVSE